MEGRQRHKAAILDYSVLDAGQHHILANELRSRSHIRQLAHFIITASMFLFSRIYSLRDIIFATARYCQ